MRLGGWNSKATPGRATYIGHDIHITTPLQLFEFASTNIPSLMLLFDHKRVPSGKPDDNCQNNSRDAKAALPQTPITKSPTGSHILNNCYQTRRVCDSKKRWA